MSLRLSRQRQLAVEERRFVVLLGVLAILIAYRDKLPKDFAFPLPYPIPHLQIFTIPLFDGFVTAFGFFAFFMLVYVSEDLYRPWVRDIFRRAAWMTLMAFWGTFIYISLGLLVSIFVPDWLIIPYLIVFWLGLSILWIGLYEYLSERKRLIRHAFNAITSQSRIKSLAKSFVKALKSAWYWLFSYRHPRVKYVTGTLFIINAILIPVFIGLSWEATQTLDDLRVGCSPYYFSDPAKENVSYQGVYNRFNASILLDNPTILTLHLFWSLSLNFNASVVDSGYLIADLGPGWHWARMQMVFQEPYGQNISLVSIGFLETESVSSILVQDKYHLTTLPYSDPAIIPAKISLGNFTANRLSNLLFRAFIEYHNLNNWAGYPICSALSGSS